MKALREAGPFRCHQPLYDWKPPPSGTEVPLNDWPLTVPLYDWKPPPSGMVVIDV